MKPYISPGVTGPSVTTVDYTPSRVSNPGLDWSHIAQAARGVTEAQGGARRAFEVSYKPRISRPMAIGNLFPFSIYNLPPVLRTTPNPSSDWRNFRCHAGYVMGSLPANTDNASSDSSPDYFGNFGSANDTTIPNTNSSFYFWLEFGLNVSNVVVGRVLYGTDQTAASYADSLSSPSNPWDHNSSPWNTIGTWASAPVPDGFHLPIANITISNNAAAAYTVRQFLREDVLYPPAFSFHYKDYANNCQNMAINVVAFGPPVTSNT